MGSPVGKRVKQFSPRRPWLSHTLQVQQFCACSFSLFPEHVWPLGTDVLRLPRGQGRAAVTPLSSAPAPLPWTSSLPSALFISFRMSRELDSPPPPPPYTSSRGKLQSFFQVSGTAARNPATRSCYFTPVLLSPWRGLNLEEDDIRAHWRLLFHRQWAWLRFASLPNLSWHFAHSVGTWEKQGASLSVLTSHCSPFLLWVPRFRASPSPPNTPNGRLTQNKKSCCLIPSCKHRTVENIKLLAGNQVPPTGHGVCPLILGCTQRKMGKITALHASFIH